MVGNFNLNFENVPKFKNPEEELAYLRAHLAEREKVLKDDGQVRFYKETCSIQGSEHEAAK